MRSSRSSGRHPGNWAPEAPKLGEPLLFLDLFACYSIFRFPTMIRILGRYPTPHGQEFERAFIQTRTEDSRKRALPRTRFVRMGRTPGLRRYVGLCAHPAAVGLDIVDSLECLPTIPLRDCRAGSAQSSASPRGQSIEHRWQRKRLVASRIEHCCLTFIGPHFSQVACEAGRKRRPRTDRSAIRVARDAGRPWFQITMQFHCFSLLFDVLNRCLVYELLNLSAIHLPIGFVIHTARGPT